MLGRTSEERDGLPFPSVEAMLDNLRDNRAELLFLAGMTVVTIYFLYATATLERSDSAAVPWVILALMVTSLVSIYASVLFGDEIKRALDFSGDEEWMELGASSQSDYAESDEVMFEIDLWGVTKELGWIAGYVFGIIFIGFFTTTIVFINAYIFLNEQSNIKRRLAYQAIWTVGGLALLYVLFVELLRVGALFRLGILP